MSLCAGNLAGVPLPQVGRKQFLSPRHFPLCLGCCKAEPGCGLQVRAGWALRDSVSFSELRPVPTAGVPLAVGERLSLTQSDRKQYFYPTQYQLRSVENYNFRKLIANV